MEYRPIWHWMSGVPRPLGPGPLLHLETLCAEFQAGKKKYRKSKVAEVIVFLPPSEFFLTRAKKIFQKNENADA